jgi:osmotically-inducible protein OsmY
MKLHSSKVLLTAVLLGGTLAGCGSTPHTAAAHAQAVPPVIASSAPVDDTITAMIREQIARELPMAAIEVSTAQGKVQLRGTVADTEAARRAVKGALGVEGVRGVVNNLTISPESGQPAALSASTSATPSL